MILLDTHIWIWWVDEPRKLAPKQLQYLHDNEQHGLGISAISCWETAKLVSLGKLSLASSVGDWIQQGLGYPGVRLIALTPDIAVESNQLPGVFHRDPADQIIVATARILGISLLTADAKILSYPHVNHLV